MEIVLDVDPTIRGIFFKRNRIRPASTVRDNFRTEHERGLTGAGHVRLLQSTTISGYQTQKTHTSRTWGETGRGGFVFLGLSDATGRITMFDESLAETGGGRVWGLTLTLGRFWAARSHRGEERRGNRKKVVSTYMEVHTKSSIWKSLPFMRNSTQQWVTFAHSKIKRRMQWFHETFWSRECSSSHTGVVRPAHPPQHLY